MSCKTILVHVDQSRHTASRIRLAAEIAVKENAHLIGAAMTGVSRYLYEASGEDLSRTALAGHIEVRKQRAAEALEQFEQVAAKSGVPSYERRLLNDDDHGGLCLQARYCDLVVLGQADRDDAAARALLDLPEYVVLNSERPVLIIPHAGRFETLSDKVLIAWDGSREICAKTASSCPTSRTSQGVMIWLCSDSTSGRTWGSAFSFR